MKSSKKILVEMSLSQWSPRAYLLPFVHHGEKSPATNTNLETLANLYGSSLDMEKQYLEMDMDLVCVNPYEISPIIMESPMSPTATLSVDVPLKGDPVSPQKNWDATYGGVFYGPQRKVKLEMEEFGDLSSFVLPKSKCANSVDELNTPIFDKDAFDFVNVYPKDSQSEELLVKLECDAYYGNSCILTDNNQFKNYLLNTENVHQNGNINSDVGNNILQSSDIDVFSPQSENESAYHHHCNLSTSNENTNTTIFNVDDNSVLSVNSNKQFSNVESINEGFQQFQHGLETPDDSNSSHSNESVEAKPPMLLLNTNFKAMATGENLNTPSIIEEVVDLESSNFNILDLVANEDMTFVNSDDIFGVPSTVVLPPPTSNIGIPPAQCIPQKRPRKRRTCSDDDEDYVPPIKKNVLHRKKIIKDDSESDDSDVEGEAKQKAKRRGRPPKRTESVSSDCSKDSGDASKYRELRDKNNEASRKSRLKRKIKELEFEKEADELIHRNIKLKAQVEELEKMVTNFRDNLFKIMIKK